MSGSLDMNELSQVSPLRVLKRVGCLMLIDCNDNNNGIE